MHAPWAGTVPRTVFLRALDLVTIVSLNPEISFNAHLLSPLMYDGRDLEVARAPPYEDSLGVGLVSVELESRKVKTDDEYCFHSYQLEPILKLPNYVILELSLFRRAFTLI